MARTRNADTIASDVQQQLRASILSGEISPGTRLKPAEIRQRYGVSVSVVREALSRLAEQRLVRSEHNRGFQVTPLSRKDLIDLTDIRVQIEGYALRRAIERGSVAWESKVVATHHALSVTRVRREEEPDKTSEDWAEAHRQFHFALVEACDMPVLLDIRSSLFDASELYRRLSAPYTTDTRDVACEHREIMEAALTRNTDLAVHRLEAHLRRTTEALLAGIFGDEVSPPPLPGRAAPRRQVPLPSA